MSLSTQQTPLNVLGQLTALTAIGKENKQSRAFFVEPVHDWRLIFESLDLLGQLGNLNMGDSSGCYKPRIDLLQKENMLCVYAELSGVKKDHLHLEVKGDMLILRGKKDMPDEYRGI